MKLYRGSGAYDNEKFLDKFLQRRNRSDSPNKLIEEPVFIELVGDVKDKSILDLGCGDASFGLDMLDRGCQTYLGVEGSSGMFEKAKDTLRGTTGNVQLSTLETFTFPTNAFDLVTSRLVFHYIEDLTPIFEQIYKSLSSEGKFVFSVQHPLLTSSTESLQKSRKRTNWLVDNYFYQGKRFEQWIDHKVIKYHRSFEDYFELVQKAGFKIDTIREPKPNKRDFSDISEYTRRMRIPMFLVFSNKKSKY